MVEDAYAPITEATMVATGNKHAIFTSVMDDAWRVWMQIPNDQQNWVQRKTMWSGAFLKKREIFRLTGIAYNGMADQAVDMEMLNTMVVALKNLANTSVQKNDTVERLVISNSPLSASLAVRDTEINRLLTVITNLSTEEGQRRRGRRWHQQRKNHNHTRGPHRILLDARLQDPCRPHQCHM